MKRYEKILILALGLFCLAAFSKPLPPPEDCLKMDRSIGIDMTSALTRNLNIPLEELQLGKTQIVLLNDVKVDYAFADYLAKKFTENDNVNTAQLDEYRKIYMDDNASNLIAQFTFFNQQNKKAIFIASALINDYECSVTFNGYLIIKREF